MKRVLWTSLASFCSTSLDEAINAHDCEALGMVELLSRAGYESWLIDPYKIASRQSSYPLKVTLEEARDWTWDMIIVYGGGNGVSQVLEGPWNSRKIEAMIDFLMERRSLVHCVLADPRPPFARVLQSDKRLDLHRFYDVFYRAPIFVPVRGMLKDPAREVLCEYWKVLGENWKPVDFNDTPAYSCVYVGSKQQTVYRRRLLETWFADAPQDAYTAGPIAIENVASLSNYKPIPVWKTREYAQQSMTVPLNGERRHTWLTPRAIQGLICGTVISIHSKFGGWQWFPDEFREQECDKLRDFDVSLRTADVYNRQVQFVKALAQTVAPMNV